MRIFTINLITAVCAVLLLPVLLSAQDQGMRRGPGSERIEQFKKVRLMETLKMDEATSIRFFTRYDKYVESLHAIQKDHNALIDQLQNQMKTDASTSELEQTIKDIQMNEEKIAESRSKFLEELKDVISVKQIAAYVVFERNFNRNLREIMQDMAKGRWNRPR